MRRRSFLGALGSILLTPTISVFGKSKNDEWKKGPYDFILDNTKKVWIIDPFIKIYTEEDKLTIFNKHHFFQQSNYILHYIPYKISENTSVTNWSTYIPLDIKVNQKTKGDMITEISKSRINYEFFELIADNGKSNLYAICDNDKFQANLSACGKSQCKIQSNF